LDSEDQQRQPPSQHKAEHQPQSARAFVHPCQCKQMSCQRPASSASMSSVMSARQPPQPAANDPAIPLCVDLDGTLIKTDLRWESAVALLRRNPVYALALLFWWTKGRAYLKQQIAVRVGRLDVAKLPYNESFLNYLRAAHRQGRPLILVTASDGSLAQQVGDHVGMFAEVLASDGKTNLRGAAKRQKLVEKYGERGFDYAGNSAVDLAVWRQARAAVIVNASSNLVRRVAKLTTVAETF
jgi:phosphoserine phosphatase